MQCWRNHRLGLQVLFYVRSGLTNSVRMAASSMELKSRMFAVEPSSFSSNPFYFRTFSDGQQAPSMTPDDWPMLAHGGHAFSVCLTMGHRVNTARLHKVLGQQVSQQLPGSEILRLISYSPENLHGSIQKGFFILAPHSFTDAQRRLCSVLRGYKQDVQLCSYRIGEGREIWQCLWELNGEAKEMVRSQVRRVDEPVSSPFVDNIKGSAVFYSLEEACEVLEECSTVIPEAKKVLASVEQYRTMKRGHFPIIVVEGLDATGKSTLTESLKSHLNAALLKSPPDSISQWRSIFDSESSLIKRAYYAVGNYIGAAEIANASKTSPVVLDRFWHSTAAYAIATEIGGDLHNLPEPHHDVYHWPDDLLRPDLVLLLTVCDEERIRRIQSRGLTVTKEEKELEVNSIFRRKTLDKVTIHVQ
ncbi:UMP-CMP kinase 2, mitochondrial isoform X2 [Hyla sarda]|uniref:UMP-CMP kinase 2, mitochondrial isoform X2 n=1 Tax=Hyla sarda TaxID=327740 RepID=UPI0024C35CB6|nr:UMP-CMP kinase 2, mitochondrial isoform X2 [Hyla sarda]